MSKWASKTAKNEVLFKMEYIKNNRYLYGFFIISFLVAFSTNINATLVDLFHEGEYVGYLWHMQDYYNGIAKFPLFVHGAIDYIPSIIASVIYGTDHVVIGTRIINVSIVCMQWFLFLDLCYCLYTRKTNNPYWAIAAVVIFLILSAPLRSLPLDVSSGFLGTRELFLFLSVWSFFKSNMSDSSLKSILFLIVGSISTSISIFWCYDRGLIAVLFFCIILLGTLVYKKLLNALYMIIFAVLSLILIEYSKIFGSVSENIYNINYWVKNTSAINPYLLDVAHFPGYFSLSILFSLSTIISFVTLKVHLRNRLELRQYDTIIFGIIVIQFMLVKLILNRADLERSFGACWPSILLMFHVGPRLFALPEFKLPNNFSLSSLIQSSNLSASHVAFKTSFFLLLLTLSLPTIWSYGLFAKKLLRPRPDVEMVSPEINKLCNVLNKVNNKLFFGWTNEGVIALMSGSRFVTNYPYVHYAAPDKEAEMIEELKKELPKAVVYDSSFWAMAIDGKKMSERFPKINNFILSNYKTRQVINSYTILIR
jgi:hypothetical protein